MTWKVGPAIERLVKERRNVSALGDGFACLWEFVGSFLIALALKKGIILVGRLRGKRQDAEK
jgi:hypothetical protein